MRMERELLTEGGPHRKTSRDCRLSDPPRQRGALRFGDALLRLQAARQGGQALHSCCNCNLTRLA
jgi:hypothetical protein